MFTLFEIEMLCACLPVMQIDAAPYALATSSEQRPIGPAGLREIWSFVYLGRCYMF